MMWYSTFVMHAAVRPMLIPVNAYADHSMNLTHLSFSRSTKTLVRKRSKLRDLSFKYYISFLGKLIAVW